MAARDVVVMTTHDIGRRLRCYGHRSVVSPHVDSLAEDGVRFARAFCTAPQCSPSRASLATGRYPHNNGVMGLAHPGFDWELDPAVPHLAALLSAAGFETHLFGGQHVSLHPERLGFTRHHDANAGPAIASAVEEVLSTGRDTRLYLEINFEETHRPYPQVDAGPTPERLDIPAYLPDIPEAAQEIVALEEGIRLMDEAAGRVLAALESAGRAENAIVVFTTDHGIAMPRAKCTLYDPGLEVALLMRWPAGGLQTGAVREELVSNIDVLPTLLDAADVKHPPGVQGRSLLPLLRGETYERRRAIFGEKTFHSYYDPMRCVRTDRHKLIRNFETAFAVEVPGDIQAGPIFRADPSLYSKDRPAVVELYDLEADPLEQRNLAGRAEVAEVEKRLNAELWRWMRETDDPLLEGPVPSPRYRLAIES
jgi:N-sulfoglucosamine sulfohydrolase